MPSARAAPEIDPDAWIASSSAILPGPMRSPLVRSRRILRRVSGMGPRRRKRVEPEHREPAAFVKRCARAIPPIPGKRDRVSIATEVWGAVPATYFIIYNEGPGADKWSRAVCIRSARPHHADAQRAIQAAIALRESQRCGRSPDGASVTVQKAASFPRQVRNADF